jgi:hypothetical protein
MRPDATEFARFTLCPRTSFTRVTGMTNLGRDVRHVESIPLQLDSPLRECSDVRDREQRTTVIRAVAHPPQVPLAAVLDKSRKLTSVHLCSTVSLSRRTTARWKTRRTPRSTGFRYDTSTTDALLTSRFTSPDIDPNRAISNFLVSTVGQSRSRHDDVVARRGLQNPAYLQHRRRLVVERRTQRLV